MQTVRLRSKIEDDGHLKVNIPTTLPKGEVDVVIVLVPSLLEGSKKKYHFSDLAGRLQWNGDAVTEQRKLRDEW
jgi:hypothetical protein